MGIHHSMNLAQTEEVLTQFVATTESIRGIEAKAERIRSHLQEAKTQRQQLTKYAEVGNTLCRSLGYSVSLMTDDMFEYFALTVDKFAYLVESLERTVLDFNLFNAPRELQKELGPVLVPAVVLVAIVTCSNIVFGFLLASDLRLALDDGSFLTVSSAQNSSDDTPNILILFAIFHVVLIFAATVFVGAELGRRAIRKRRWQKLRAQRRVEKKKQQEAAEEERRRELETLEELPPPMLDTDLISPRGRVRFSHEDTSGPNPRLAPSRALRNLQRTTASLYERRRAQATSTADATSTAQATSTARIHRISSAPNLERGFDNVSDAGGGVGAHSWTLHSTPTSIRNG